MSTKESKERKMEELSSDTESHLSEQRTLRSCRNKNVEKNVLHKQKIELEGNENDKIVASRKSHSTVLKSRNMSMQENIENEQEENTSESNSSSSDDADVKGLPLLDVKRRDISVTPRNQTVHERLKAHFGDLQQKEITAVFDLSDSDEVSLLRMPRDANVNLKYANVHPESRCKIYLRKKYVLTPTSKTPDPCYVVSTNCGVVNFKKNIKMEKYLKSKSKFYLLKPKEKTVPFPENLKQRHPLLGSDFQQRIRLSDHAEKKLDNAIANFLKREKAKKKKREDMEDDENNDQEIFYLLYSHSFSANGNKFKTETSEDCAFGSSSSIDRLKIPTDKFNK